MKRNKWHVPATRTTDGNEDAVVVRRAIMGAIPPGTSHIALLVALGDLTAQCLAFAPERRSLSTWFVRGLRLCLKQRVADRAHQEEAGE